MLFLYRIGRFEMIAEAPLLSLRLRLLYSYVCRPIFFWSSDIDNCTAVEVLETTTGPRLSISKRPILYKNNVNQHAKYLRQRSLVFKSH